MNEQTVSSSYSRPSKFPLHRFRAVRRRGDTRIQIMLLWHLGQALSHLMHNLPWIALSSTEKRRLNALLSLLESDFILARRITRTAAPPSDKTAKAASPKG